MELKIPKLSLVLMVGASGSGKSTFARKHFLPTEVVSSDYCRGLVSDDENDQSATQDAYDLLATIVRKRLARGRLTVIDATNVQKESRKSLLKLAKEYHALPVAIVLNLPVKQCYARNQSRPDRKFGIQVIRGQQSNLRQSLGGLKREGFRHVFVLSDEAEIDAATIVRVPLWCDRRDQRGPLDIIGDVHGCGDELEELLVKLGYVKTEFTEETCTFCEQQVWSDVFSRREAPFYYAHPENRKAVFVGDLVDRGPRVLDTLCIVRNMITAGTALCVPGNHDMKLLRKLSGRDVKITHGLAQTMAEIEALPVEIRIPFCQALCRFLDDLVSHYVLDDGRLVVAHAGMKESMQGRGSGAVREYALYGETTGETDEFGLPVRQKWAAEYRGKALVVYGHTPVASPEWLNNTVNVDTGCVFGGALSALKYPELEIVQVPALKEYCPPSRPFLPSAGDAALSPQMQVDSLLDAEDVVGKRIISTRLQPKITIQEENANAALEVMSRFAADPRWLIYLPPTMSPCETSTIAGFLEHPNEAFNYYLNQGVLKVVCQEKHMGSRAVIVLCRDASTAEARFGVDSGETGIIYTRTGRRFFDDSTVESQLLNRLSDAMAKVGMWDELHSDWVCLDCELMPWSAKAQELLRNQYAAVGSAGRSALPESIISLEMALNRLPESEKATVQTLLQSQRQNENNIHRFISAYQRYCWQVTSINDYKIAPFHLLASEGSVHVDKDHAWHMDTIQRICDADSSILMATDHCELDLSSDADRERGIQWWIDRVGRGSEGMVVKPASFVARGSKGIVQPAVKCRGPEYLRIIYGPDYDSDSNLPRLRNRSLGRKRALAMHEFSLGVESLERFVRREPLRRTHECVFGVLALESEPVDPRL